MLASAPSTLAFPPEFGRLMVAMTPMLPPECPGAAHGGEIAATT
jgi:hypothetical protein